MSHFTKLGSCMLFSKVASIIKAFRCCGNLCMHMHTKRLIILMFLSHYSFFYFISEVKLHHVTFCFKLDKEVAMDTEEQLMKNLLRHCWFVELMRGLEEIGWYIEWGIFLREGASLNLKTLKLTFSTLKRKCYQVPTYGIHNSTMSWGMPWNDNMKALKVPESRTSGPDKRSVQSITGTTHIFLAISSFIFIFVVPLIFRS